MVWMMVLLVLGFVGIEAFMVHLGPWGSYLLVFPTNFWFSMIAKPCFCAPVSLNNRYRSLVCDHVEAPTILSLPLKTKLTSVKNKACPLRVVAFVDTWVNKQQNDEFYLQNLNTSPLKRGSYLPRASKNTIFNLPPYPAMTEKPKWWWRSLACLPYLMNFLDQLTWTYAHPKNNPPPFLENFDNLAFPLHSALFALPKFFLSGYPIMLYFFVVRRKEWPHFFRYHVVSAILMGSLLQVIGISSNWFPSRFFPPHFWSAATFLFMATVFECIRSALAGEYPGIPFVKDAARLHCDLNIR